MPHHRRGIPGKIWATSSALFISIYDAPSLVCLEANAPASDPFHCCLSTTADCSKSRERIDRAFWDDQLARVDQLKRFTANKKVGKI